MSCTSVPPFVQYALSCCLAGRGQCGLVRHQDGVQALQQQVVFTQVLLADDMNRKVWLSAQHLVGGEQGLAVRIDATAAVAVPRT